MSSTAQAASLFVCIVVASGAQASSLSVTPIKIEVVEPGASSSAILRNGGDQPLNAQIRVFRWTQTDGEDTLESSQDVIASPPVASIDPHGEFHVRVMRTSQEPIQGEENYRLVIDELPDANRQKNGLVSVVVRYVVPLQFLSADASQSRLTWSITNHDRRTFLAATNSGDKSARIADLSLGKTVVGKGLAGYVLGHSTKFWPLKGASSGEVKARSEQGPINAALAR